MKNLLNWLKAFALVITIMAALAALGEACNRWPLFFSALGMVAFLVGMVWTVKVQFFE